MELDELEIEAALSAARKEKYFYLRRLEYSKTLMEDITPPKYTAEQMLEAYAKRWSVDDENRAVVEDLCRYFADDKRFSGKLDRGILIYGAVGVGKTELMRFFFKNQKQSFVMTSCRQVESAYATDGNEGLQPFSALRQVNAANSDPFGHRILGFCFDDLGTEPPATKYYGTEKAAMTEVILNRYDLNFPFPCTHITTNLSADELEPRYGTRAVDRMREMFNFIQFKTEKSRRVQS